MNDLLPSIQSLGLWGYWVIGLLAFGEALVLTSLFSPGTVIVVLGGALVAQGFYDFGDMIWFVAIGTTLGAELSFRIGEKGEGLFGEDNRVFKTAHLERGKKFFAKYGAPSIIIGHFFGPLRPIVPVVAGLSGMSRRRFFAWNVVGGFAYTIALLSVGYFFGTAFDFLGATATRAGLFVLALLLGFALLWYLSVKLRQALPFLISVARSVGQAVRDNPDVRALLGRHPRLFGFVANRLSRQTFTGLPLTGFVIVFGYFLILYAGSTLSFITSQSIVQADIRVANLLFAFRDPALVQFFTIVTAFGYWKIIVILALALSLVLWAGQRISYLPGLWLALVGNQVTVSLLKIAFARPRPELAVYTESSFSFPSGHSAVSVAFYGFVVFVLVRERFGPRLVPLLAGAIGVFLIGLSRLYLVEHYLSDVLNGYLVGALWLLVGIWLVEWRRAGKGHLGVSRPSGMRKLIQIGLIVSAGAGVWISILDYQQTLNIRAPARIAQLSDPLETAFLKGILPTHSENIFGVSQEPVSLAILAKSEAGFLGLLKKAGWQLADGPNLNSLSRAAYAVWFRREYGSAPITPAFWNGKPQPHDFGFQQETADKNLRKRHHARFWRTGFRTRDGLLIFVGTASFDDGLKWGLTHRIDPNIDAERDFLADDLRKTGLLAKEYEIQLVPPVLGTNLTGDPFFTDGRTLVLRVAPVSN
ncbi:MAG: phosphatase PAP2 family protein [Alphaproteobacteria bacterium]|nr:phosphatase PAP2 family protein [Alphaproteobacteria bacterium]